MERNFRRFRRSNYSHLLGSPNNQLGKAEAEGEWFAAWHDTLRSTMGSIEPATIMRNGLNNCRKLDLNEQAVFSTNMTCLFDYADLLRRLNKQRYVADDILEPVMRNLVAIINSPGGAVWWNQVTIFEYVNTLSKSGIPSLTEVMDYFNLESLSRVSTGDA